MREWELRFAPVAKTDDITDASRRITAFGLVAKCWKVRQTMTNDIDSAGTLSVIIVGPMLCRQYFNPVTCYGSHFFWVIGCAGVN